MSFLTLVPLTNPETAGEPGSASDGAASNTRPPIVVGPAGVTIGRAAGSDVVLEDPHLQLSRLQAVIGGTGGFRLRNVGKGGPVRLDGRNLTAGTDRTLGEGQQVQIGTHLFLVRMDSAHPVDAVAGNPPLRTVAMLAAEEPRTELLAEHDIERLPGLPHGSAKAAQGRGSMSLPADTPWPTAAAGGPSDESDPFADLLGPAPVAGSLPAEWADPDARHERPGFSCLPGLSDQAVGPLAEDEIDRFIDGLAMVEERVDARRVPAAPGHASALATDTACDMLSTAWRPPHAALQQKAEMPASSVSAATRSPAAMASVAKSSTAPRPVRPPAQPERVMAQVSAAQPRQVPQGATVRALRPGPDVMTTPALDDATLCAAFWKAAGLPEETGCRDPAVMAAAGALLHAAVDALLQHQAARTAAKRAFAVQVTSIQPRDNNPLKFSPDAGSAIAMLLRRGNQGFMAGPQAVSALTADLSDHHAASTAGLHGALHQLLRRLDPATVESLIPPPSRLETWVPKLRAARLWAAFRQQHQRALIEGDEGWRAFAERSYAQAYQDYLLSQRQQSKGGCGATAGMSRSTSAVQRGSSGHGH